MLLSKIYEKRDNIKRREKGIRIALLIIAASVLRLCWVRNEVATEQFNEFRIKNEADMIRKGERDLDASGSFETEKFSNPAETILVCGRQCDREHIREMIKWIDIEEMACRNIRVTLDNHATDKLEYFSVVNLVYDSASFVEFCPFRSVQPKSEYLFSAEKYFHGKTLFDFDIIREHPVNINAVTIHMTPSSLDRRRLFAFLKAVQRVEYWNTGTHSHMPLPLHSVNTIWLFLFLVVMATYSFFSGWVEDDFQVSRDFPLVFLYAVSPLTIFLFLNKSHSFVGGCIVFFSIVDFRWSIVYSVIILGKNFISIVKEVGCEDADPKVNAR